MLGTFGVFGILPVLFAVEPCSGFTLPEQLEGERVWVEYDERLSPARAEAILAEADGAYAEYVDDFGWPAPPSPFSVIADFDVDSASGRCITVECDDGTQLPSCSVYAPALLSGRELNTTAHEVGHAFQYGITGPFSTSLAQWAWWMEGTAEYMSYRRVPVPGTLSVIAEYAGNPQWRLHHTFSAFITGERTGHMYGTAVLAMFIDEYYGGPTTIREIWEWGSVQGEEAIFFRDAIEGIGVSFDAFWPDYLAHLSVLDLEVGPQLQRVPAHLEFDSLPGAATPPDIYFPEGLGIAFFRVPADLGQPDSDLVVRVLGDPMVRWHGMLARVDDVSPGASVLDFVGGQSDADGVVSLRLGSFDGEHDVMVGLSPESIEGSPFAFRIEAELAPAADTEGGSDDGMGAGASTTNDMDTDEAETDGVSGATDSGGCACAVSDGGAVDLGHLGLGWFGVLALLRLTGGRCARRRRRERAPASKRPRSRPMAR